MSGAFLGRPPSFDEVSGRDLDELFQGVLFDALVPVVPEYEEALRGE